MLCGRGVPVRSGPVYIDSSKKFTRVRAQSASRLMRDLVSPDHIFRAWKSLYLSKSCSCDRKSVAEYDVMTVLELPPLPFLSDDSHLRSSASSSCIPFPCLHLISSFGVRNVHLGAASVTRQWVAARCAISATTCSFVRTQLPPCAVYVPTGPLPIELPTSAKRAPAGTSRLRERGNARLVLRASTERAMRG